MSVSKIPKGVLALVEPAMWALASKLLILTAERKGSAVHKPSVSTFYETGIVTALYEALLMNPALAHLEIRHEMAYKTGSGKGAPRQVDLWLRPYNGGNPTMIEAGDFSAPKVHRDLKKLKALNPKGANWFLAFFRKAPDSANPWGAIRKSLAQPTSGLDASIVAAESRLTRSFTVFRPGANGEAFGVSLLRGK